VAVRLKNSGLKKILEKPVKKEDLENIRFIYSGISAIDEKGRRLALEKDTDFMEKYGKSMSPVEFNRAIFSKHIKKELIPRPYLSELERYRKMLIDKVANVLGKEELKNTELGQIIGIPDAEENLFELRKENKVIGFVLLNQKDSKIDFIESSEDLPKDFKKKIK
jgi:hypothetical protein